MRSDKSKTNRTAADRGPRISEIRKTETRMLFEGKNPVEVAKYYFKGEPEQLARLTAKDNDLLKRLAVLDVEYNPEKFEVGKIFPWIVALYKKGDRNLIELMGLSPDSTQAKKFRNAQQLFSKPQFRKTSGISDINRIPSLRDFMEKVGSAFVEKSEVPSSPRFSAEEINNDIREGNIAKTSVSNDRFLVITPLKKKGACKYGNVHMDVNAGRWCTAKEKDNAFDSYKDGILYIFMDRKDGYLSKYQLHYKDGNYQFKNEFNRDFDYEQFFDENTDIFDRLFPKVAESIKADKPEGATNLMRIFKLLPKSYKQKVRDQFGAFATGVLKAMLECMRNVPGAEDALDRYDAIGFDYDSIDFFPDGMRINCDLDSIYDGLKSWYWVYKQEYDGFEFDREEYDYMHNYIPDDIKDDFMHLIRYFKPDFTESDYDDQGKIDDVIGQKPAYKYFERLLDNYASEYTMAINRAHDVYIDSTIMGLPFDLERESIFIRYETLLNYCIEAGVTDMENILQIIELVLEREGVNDDNLYNHHENSPDFSQLEKRLRADLDDVKDKIEDDMGNFEQNKKNHELLQKYIKELGFTKGTNGRYGKKTEFASMQIGDPDYEKGTVHMEYMDLKNDKKIHKGDIRIDNLPKYATMQMMFESVRRFVRNILSNSINENKNINEGVDYSNVEFDIKRLFRKYDNELPSEENTVRGLRDSLELIDGNGAIEEKSHYDRKGDRLMYKEMLDNDNLILVIHAALKRPPYGGEYGYQYEIGLYRNNPQSYQIGGGYGASGIVGTKHTRLIGYGDYDIVHHNKSILSKVIGFLKEKLENPQLSLNDKEYKVGDRVDTKISKTLPYPQQYQYYNRWGVLTGIDAENDKYTLRMNDSGEEETFKKDSLQ